MALIFLLLLVTMIILIRMLAKWCLKVSKLLETTTAKEAEDYMETALREERERKGITKKEVLSSKYLSGEYLIKGTPVVRDYKVRRTVGELIKSMEKEWL